MVDTRKLYTLHRHDAYFSCSFRAMASPCELLISTDDKQLADQLSQQCITEIHRIEKKFSRYLSGNLCYAINHANGSSIEIDDECYRLLQFAQTCYELSDGMFDLSSGVLRRVWQFDCSDRIPTQEQIEAVLHLVSWENVDFTTRRVQMAPQMEIDFGGIGKEYAVSRAAGLCHKYAANTSVLINLGGDIQITQPRKNNKPWMVGIENDARKIHIHEGALATSGDSKRYLLKDGKRYSHILNPKTGWPIEHAPASITTAAPLCVQAGCLATLALLRGKNAEKFLSEQDVPYWATYL